MNEDRKQAFMAEYKTAQTRARCESLFGKMSYYEKEVGHDICNMSYDELCDALHSLGYGQITLATGAISLVRSYLSWCVDHGYAKSNILKGQASLKLLAAQVCTSDDDYVTRQDIWSAATYFGDKPQQATFYHAYMLCLYEGVEDGDVANLESLHYSDVSGNKVRISNGKTIPISSELKRLLYEASILREMNTTAWGSERNYIVPLTPYEDQRSDAVFKGTKHGKSDRYTRSKRFRKCLIDVEAATGKHWTRECIRKSGLWDRFVLATKSEGLDLMRDMITHETPLTTTCENKDIVYTRILNQLQSSMKWSEWLNMYSTWETFLEE